MSSIINQSPFIKTSREFPKDLDPLTNEINRSYVETARAINERTIGLYPTNRPAITGDNYFYNKNQKQQSLRQIYRFMAPIAASYPHGINPQSIDQFSPNTYGQYNDGTNYYGAIFGTNQVIPGQVSFYIDGTANTIVILQGAGAPAITEILILLEWISTI
jgi:hypothetical protein